MYDSSLSIPELDSSELAVIWMDFIERVCPFRFYKRRDVSGLNKALLDSRVTRRRRIADFCSTRVTSTSRLSRMFTFFVMRQNHTTFDVQPSIKKRKMRMSSYVFRGIMSNEDAGSLCDLCTFLIRRCCWTQKGNLSTR